MTKGKPEFDPNRFELVDDPEIIKLEKWLNTPDAWELDDASTDDVLEVLQRSKILVEKPKYSQLSLF